MKAIKKMFSDKGLTLETSALESLYDGQFTLSTLLINQTFEKLFNLDFNTSKTVEV